MNDFTYTSNENELFLCAGALVPFFKLGGVHSQMMTGPPEGHAA